MSEKLRLLLEKKGITVYQLAKKLNLPLQTVYSWFQGKRKPNIVHSNKLAKFFKVSIKYFL